MAVSVHCCITIAVVRLHDQQKQLFATTQLAQEKSAVFATESELPGHFARVSDA